MKIYFLLFFVLLFLSDKTAFTQSISGDTIFVHTEAEVDLIFPQEVDESKFTQTDGLYSKKQTRNKVTLRSKVENASCQTLQVFEGPGPRTHRIIVCYKKDLDFNNPAEVIYDWGTVKKLQQFVDSKAKSKLAVSASKPEVTGAKPAVSNDKVVNNPPYLTLLEEGDKALQNESFDLAQQKYEEVIKIQPGNVSARRGLIEVKEKKLEKENLDKKAQADKINRIKTTANNAFLANRYDEALASYNEALELNPNDLYSKNQVAEIYKRQAEIAQKDKQAKEMAIKKESDDRINRLRVNAARASDEKKYDDAIAIYNEILLLSPNDVLAKNRVETIEKIKAQNEKNQKLERETRDREEQFKTIMANADKAFDLNDFEVAKAGYLTAKELKPTDIVLERKLKSTNDKILLKDKEENYKTAIRLGDEAKNSGAFDKAKEEYRKASELFIDRPYPAEQIRQINKIINDALAAKNSEKTYQATIDRAEKAMEKKDYIGARVIYSEAAKLKPEETYPKERLSEITLLIKDAETRKNARADSIALIIETNKKYNALISSGKIAFEKKDYDKAKEAYLQALELKPAETEPKDKLELIEQKLSVAASGAKFDDAVSKGNLALGESNYNLALENYKEAQKLNPRDTYIISQIKYIQSLLAQEESKKTAAEAIKQNEADLVLAQQVYRKRFTDGMRAYRNYQSAAQIANYEDQLHFLKLFLNIIPDNSLFNDRQFDTDLIGFAKDKIKAIRESLTRTKGSAYQIEAIPYLNLELESKYENLNFAIPPEGQVFTPATDENAGEKERTIKDVLAEKPRLSLQGSSNNVKITCQSISFKGGNAYFKIQIQNSETTEFLTGPITLTQAKASGGFLKHDPTHISAYPIVLPGKEFVIVYEVKDFAVAGKDILTLEMKDRLKKSVIQVNIPGSVFIEEKERKL